jgi:hypothetical protein
MAVLRKALNAWNVGSVVAEEGVQPLPILLTMRSVARNGISSASRHGYPVGRSLKPTSLEVRGGAVSGLI